MKQITENYVSFEIAKLLKDKKALINYNMGYDEDGDLCNAMKCGVIDGKRVCILNGNDKLLMAPTHQMAMKWLREVHRIEIHIALSELNPDNSRKYMIDIFSSDTNRDFDSIQRYGFDSFEEACESAIKYVLENLI